MSAPAPVAVGYVAGLATSDQQKAVVDYATAEGIALAEVITDQNDILTISQVVEAARLHDAKLLLLPDDAPLSTALHGIEHSLSKHGAVCVVVPTGCQAGRRAEP